ncbi:Chaperone DnaJ-domain superfamily protein [Prunus dulcis]|uniref:Chaperone DnaJ-domain superfamily protein n=1 Tax=Prunus dulcis TaxID=3755 RepID=A0A4Y1RUA4_PRUDU|nr:Chaperone DnaJ-domain superfamily protein [Prunus dulcis]
MSRFNNHSRRSGRNHAKQTLLRNVNAYADFLFQSWQKEYDEDEPSSSKGTSWFKKQYSAKGSKKNGGGNQGAWNSGRSKEILPSSWNKAFHAGLSATFVRQRPLGVVLCGLACEPYIIFIILEVAYDLSAICNAISGGFQCCEEDIDVETIFRSTFGGTKFYYWSFIDEESSQWRSSSNHSNYGSSWNWRQQNKEEYETESESESERSESDERLALGLSASGPLTLEDVKNAYRISALKWHPDRHQGSSKAAAEEKFKLCSAAYQSLCDKLAVN